MIEVRVATKIDQEVNILQSEFRPIMGTREGIFNLRTICETALEVGKEVHMFHLLCQRRQIQQVHC